MKQDLTRKQFDVLALLAQSPKALSQRQIEEKTGYSLGTVNRTMQELTELGYVADGVITKEVANAALLRLEVDEMGLDATDRRMLRSIIEFYHGGPVGLETLAATIGEEAVTLEDVYEPYLLQQGFLTRTPRGRCVTRRAYEHLGLEYIGQQEIDL